MKFLLLNAQTSIGAITPMGKKNQRSLWAQPLGLLYIGAVLEQQGHQVELIDFVAEDFSEDKLRSLLSSLDAVGISVDSYGYKQAQRIAHFIKQIDHHITIIIGGPHCTFYPEKSLVDIPDADISVEGEGEHVITDIILALQGKKKLETIAGIRFRKKDNIIQGKPPHVIIDLDALPFPARHLVDKYDYGKFGKHYFYKSRFTSIATTRGCPFQCRFCTRHIVGMKDYRQRSVDNIIAELLEINDNHGSVLVVDDSFLSDKKRVHGIMDEIISQGIDLEIIIQGSRVDIADEDLYRKMKKAGVKAINFGIESGNQDVLDFYRKGITLEQVKKAVNLSNKMGFLTVGNFVLGAPIETKDHIHRTIRFANSLPIDLISFTILHYNYHSDLWDDACRDGKISMDDGYSIMADSRKGLGNFTSEELIELQNQALKSFYLRPRYILHQILRSLKTGDFSLFQLLYYSKPRL